MAKQLRVFWSVDPFSKNEGQVRNAIGALKALAKKAAVRVVPVSVVSPDAIDWPTTFEASWKREFGELAERSLKSALKGVRFKGMEKPKVILQTAHSRRESVMRLLQEAKAMGADLILASTHLRKGSGQLFVGSFTEALVNQSPLPVLTINPQASGPTQIKRILFSTDFSIGSRRAFDGLVEIAAALEAEILLFHRLMSPIDPVVQSGMMMAGGFANIEALMESDEEEKRREAERWVARGMAEGVRVTPVFASGAKGLADMVITVARRHRADCVALATLTGPVGAAVFGSVARQVMRRASVPVLVIRSR